MRVVFTLVVAAVLVGAFIATRSTEALNPNIQNQFDLAMDADPVGNTATSLGALDPCVAVDVNDTFEVDLVVQGVPEPGIAALEANIIYDPDIVRIVGKDASSYMLGVGGQSISLGDNFSPLPDSTGDYYVAELNLSADQATGDGVIVRLTFQALAPGGTTLTWDNTNPSQPDYVPVDENWDGIPDVFYVDLEAEPEPDYIGVFPNMRARGAEVVVDGSCPGNLLDGDGDGYSDLYEDYTESLVLNDCAATSTANDEQFDSWPTDFDDSQSVNIADVVALKPVFNESGPAIARYDLAPSGSINIADVVALKPVFGMSCAP